MPSSIPVQVGDQQFNSMNQARLFYRDILYRYQTGHVVDGPDRFQVLSLLTSAAIGKRLPSSEDAVRVVKRSFGRKCFELQPKDEPGQTVSILRAVRECASGRKAANPASGSDVGKAEWIKKG